MTENDVNPENSPPRRPDAPGLPRTGHHQVEFPFGTLDFFTHHVEIRVRSGVHLDFAEFDAVIEAIHGYFGDRPFGYLNVRKSDYSVNPMAGRKVVLQTGVVAGAFVVGSENARRVLDVEKLFYQRPVAACATIEEADQFLAGFIRGGE